MADPQLTRAHVLAYRMHVQQLDRVGDGPPAVYDLGVQESGANAALVMAARGADPPGDGAVLTWSLRCAPHWHRAGDLDWLPAALWPLSDADAIARLLLGGRTLTQAGFRGLDAYEQAVRAMRAAVPRATAKGAASTAMTAALPEPFRSPCRGCGSPHVPDGMFRLCALPAGLLLEPGTSPPVLRRAPGRWSGPPARTGHLERLITAYLHLLGPATVGQAADYLGIRTRDLHPVWPDDGIATVRVEGRPAYACASDVDAMRSATRPPGHVVRLLGPFDPWMQARDRDLIVPDTALHKPLWPVLGRPGAVFVDGEVAGVWRTATSGSRLDVKLTLSQQPSRPVASALAAEVQLVGRVRGARDVRSVVTT